MFQASNIAKRSQTTSQWSPSEEPPADFHLLGNVWLLLCLCEWHKLVWQVRVLIVITFICFLAICTYCSLRNSLNSVMWSGSSSEVLSGTVDTYHAAVLSDFFFFKHSFYCINLPLPQPIEVLYILCIAPYCIAEVFKLSWMSAGIMTEEKILQMLYLELSS